MRAAVFDIRADLRRSPSTQTVSGSPHDVESVGGIGPDADGHEAEAGLHARTDMRHAAAGGNRKGSRSSISQNSTLPGGRTERTGSGRRARESQPPCTGDELPMPVVSVQLGEAPGRLRVQTRKRRVLHRERIARRALPHSRSVISRLVGRDLHYALYPGHGADRYSSQSNCRVTPLRRNSLTIIGKRSASRS